MEWLVSLAAELVAAPTEVLVLIVSLGAFALAAYAIHKGTGGSK